MFAAFIIGISNEKLNKADWNLNTYFPGGIIISPGNYVQTMHIASGFCGDYFDLENCVYLLHCTLYLFVTVGVNIVSYPYKTGFNLVFAIKYNP